MRGGGGGGPRRDGGEFGGGRGRAARSSHPRFPPSAPPSRLLDDPTLAHFFDAATIGKHKVIVGKFLVAALGGPNEYKGRNMVDAHVGVVGLRYPEDFNTVAGHLAAVLTELGVTPPLHDEVMAVAASLAPDFEKVAKFRSMLEADT